MFDVQIANGRLVISCPINPTPRETKAMHALAEGKFVKSDCDYTMPDGTTRKVVVNMFVGVYKDANK